RDAVVLAARPRRRERERRQLRIDRRAREARLAERDRRLARERRLAALERDDPALGDRRAEEAREDRGLHPERALAARVVDLQEITLDVAASLARVEADGVEHQASRARSAATVAASRRFSLREERSRLIDSTARAWPMRARAMIAWKLHVSRTWRPTPNARRS